MDPIRDKIPIDPFEYTDLTFSISKFLSIPDLLCCCRVNQTWNKNFETEDIWKLKSDGFFSMYEKNQKISWKKHMEYNYSGLFPSSLYFYNSNIVSVCKTEMIYYNIHGRRQEKTCHLGSLKQMIFFPLPNFELIYATIATDGYLKLWDNRFEKEAILSMKVHDFALTSIQKSDKRFYISSVDGFLKCFKYIYHKEENQTQFNLELIYETKLENDYIKIIKVKKENKERDYLFGGTKNGNIVIYAIDAKGFHRLQNIKAHHSSITALEFYSRANCLITGSVDKTLKIWSRNEFGQYGLFQKYQTHLGSVTSILTDPLRLMFYSASLDGTILGWKFSTKDSEWGLESINHVIEGKISRLAICKWNAKFSDTQEITALLDDGTIYFWDQKDLKNTNLTLESDPKELINIMKDKDE